MQIHPECATHSSYQIKSKIVFKVSDNSDYQYVASIQTYSSCYSNASQSEHIQAKSAKWHS
jgi:hypothetical protein